MESSAEVWRTHFASLESGRVVMPGDLAARAVLEQTDRCLPATFDMEYVPSMLDFELALRGARAGRAWGLDGIPPELLRCHAPELARVFYPVLLKTFCFLSEPLIWKGGELIKLYKGKGSRSSCSNFRAILLSSSVGKAVHSLVRNKASPFFEREALPLQAGGRPGQSALFPAQALRCFLRSAKASLDSAGVLFFDLQTAFYTVIRHLSIGRTCSDYDVAGIVRDLGLPPEACSELRRLLTCSPASDSVGLPEPLSALLTEMHTCTWFLFSQSPHLTETLRGTRPGDALADLVFNFLFLRVLKQAEQELADSGLLANLTWSGQRTLWPSAWDTRATLSDLVWTDDLALPFRVTSAGDLLYRAKVCAAATLDSLSARGMIANTARGKTECILAPRGSGAVAVRAGLFATKHPTLLALTELGPSYSIGLVSCYKHLGGLVAADGGMLSEIVARKGKASAAFKRNRRAVFCNRLVMLERRVFLLRSSVLSILLRGAGTWPWLCASEFHAYATALLSFLRQVCRAGLGKDFGPLTRKCLSHAISLHARMCCILRALGTCALCSLMVPVFCGLPCSKTPPCCKLNVKLVCGFGTFLALAPCRIPSTSGTTLPPLWFSLLPGNAFLKKLLSSPSSSFHGRLLCRLRAELLLMRPAALALDSSTHQSRLAMQVTRAFFVGSPFGTKVLGPCIQYVSTLTVRSGQQQGHATLRRDSSQSHSLTGFAFLGLLRIFCCIVALSQSCELLDCCIGIASHAYRQQQG